ncbi:hypothetical protein D1007_46914 [Hordeum vulgare]|nr:hypothetical protein D1007_46914 [Hordeum vulgare]
MTRAGPPTTEADGHRQVGGQFWALAEGAGDNEDEDDELPTAVLREVASPTPSDTIWEAFDMGYSEDDVAVLVDTVIPQDYPTRQGLMKTDRVEMA